MRFVRFQTGKEKPQYGWLYEDMIGRLEGTPYEEFKRLDIEFPLQAVKLLPPVLPGKIICVGRNYAEHAREQGVDVPELPMLFLKPPSSVIGPGDAIQLPPQSAQVEHEAELAVVIGRRGKWVTAEDAVHYILGYTIANDVTARDLQRRDGQWTRGKGFDTFCPLGPWIDTNTDPADVLISCRVNGELRQMASTREMVFTVQQLVAFVTSIMTVEPGDVILTGTPAGIGPLAAGDIVSISDEGLGDPQNPGGKAPQQY